MPHHASTQALEARKYPQVLPFGPTVKIDDPEWDETVLDFSDPEQITATQVDEHGVTHTVILSHDMMLKLRVHFLKWLTANTQ